MSNEIEDVGYLTIKTVPANQLSQQQINEIDSIHGWIHKISLGRAYVLKSHYILIYRKGKLVFVENDCTSVLEATFYRNLDWLEKLLKKCYNLGYTDGWMDEEKEGRIGGRIEK